jgi:hypothetical protein
MLLESSKPGGLVEKGSRPDRSFKTLQSNIESAEKDSPGEVAARCFGCFNRKPNASPYKNAAKLREVLEVLFNLEPKLRAKQMCEEMRKMHDSDGGLLFCYSKRTTNGLLLSEDQIQSWINTRTQKKKKKNKEPSKKEQEQARLIAELGSGV